MELLPAALSPKERAQTQWAGQLCFCAMFPVFVCGAFRPALSRAALGWLARRWSRRKRKRKRRRAGGQSLGEISEKPACEWRVCKWAAGHLGPKECAQMSGATSWVWRTS